MWGSAKRAHPPRLPPPLGGALAALAKRAAPIADRFYSPAGENWKIHRQACLDLGKPDPGERFKALGPIYTHVTNDPEGDWAKIAPTCCAGNGRR